MHGDGGGLYLKISRAGARSWIHRVTVAGRRRDLGLGRFPDVGLAQAREAAAHNRSLIASGGDPLAEKRKAAIPTFREAAEQTFEVNKPRWRNGKHRVTWWQSLERHAFPILGDMPVDQIGREDVLRVLSPIWGVRMETAAPLRHRIPVTRQLRTEPATPRSPKSITLHETGASPNHLRALPYAEVGELIEAVQRSQASLAAKWCLEYLILTATRSGEARGARWSEIDLDAATWTIPAERMKAHAEHRVPLSSRALAILKEARTIDDGSGLVFPSPTRPGRLMSDITLTAMLRRLKVADRATVHGFRSAFRDWAAECTHAPHAVMELSLAHAVGNAVEAAYARSDLFERRRALMNQWADYLHRDSGTVVSMARHGG